MPASEWWIDRGCGGSVLRVGPNDLGVLVGDLVHGKPKVGLAIVRKLGLENRSEVSLFERCAAASDAEQDERHNHSMTSHATDLTAELGSSSETALRRAFTTSVRCLPSPYTAPSHDDRRVAYASCDLSRKGQL
jgi:hypothetical protein